MMIVPSDKDYLETKLIKRGDAVLCPDFAPLAEWICEHYLVKLVKPLNIVYDITAGPHNKPFPRINVVFEWEGDSLKFRDRCGNYDPDMQRAIADKFDELVNKRVKLQRMRDNLVGTEENAKYDTKGVLVIFTSFEPVAKAEANEAVTKAEIEALITKQNTSELWEISRFDAIATAFFYTDQQAEEAKSSDLLEQLRTKYYQLLKKYDEFDYYDIDSFRLDVDSKENFDNNFKSNWFYYYK